MTVAVATFSRRSSNYGGLQKPTLKSKHPTTTPSALPTLDLSAANDCKEPSLTDAATSTNGGYRNLRTIGCV